MSAGGATYVPTVQGSPAQVAEGGRATVTVTYARAGGTLRVTVTGYPPGAGGSAVHYRGSAGSGSLSYTESGTYHRALTPGTYSLSVSPPYVRSGVTTTRPFCPPPP